MWRLGLFHTLPRTPLRFEIWEMCGHLSDLIFEQKLNFNCQRKVNEKSESKVKEIKRKLYFSLPVWFFNRFVVGLGRPLIRIRIRLDSLTLLISVRFIRFDFIHFHSKSSSPISRSRLSIQLSLCPLESPSVRRSCPACHIAIGAKIILRDTYEYLTPTRFQLKRRWQLPILCRSLLFLAFVCSFQMLL